MNALAEIGHNNPPIDEFDIITDKINTLFIEAENWIDGTQITTQPEADGIAQLLVLARDAAQELDKLRVNEKKPHDEAAKAVQAKYKPSLARADTIMNACKTNLGAWLAMLNAELRLKEEATRIDAELKAKAAQEAIRAASGGSLAEKERAELLLEEAKRAGIGAASAANEQLKLKLTDSEQYQCEPDTDLNWLI